MKAIAFLVFLCLAACSGSDTYMTTVEIAAGGCGGFESAGAGGEETPPPVAGCASDADCGPCGVCTAAADCQPHPAGLLCRPAAGFCDVAEFCDGVSLACPVDEVRPYGFAPEIAGVPDTTWCQPYACDGYSVDCPAACVEDAGCAPGFVCGPSFACEAAP